MSQEGLAAVQLGIADAMAVFETLTDEEWARPSGCDGWRVQDVAAHTSSNFKATADPSPPSEPPPPLPAERLMDLLVEPRLSWSPAQVLEELRAYGPGLVQALDALQEEPLASAPMTMADLGTYSMHQLADAYAFDLYCHLRIDVLAPHGPIEREVPSADESRVAPAVGWMLAGLPKMQGAAFPFVDRPFTLRLTGTGGSRWTIRGSGDGNVDLESAADPGSVATITSDAHDFVLWGTKRADWRGLVTVDGDTQLAQSFLDTLNIV
jgi:uncharacterized protein (TIGR03083 family)